MSVPTAGSRPGASADPAADPDPFDAVPLEELRLRTSAKWRTHPPDVLPLFVAEMDARVAAPVVEAVGDAMRRGDTGYPAGTAYAEAFDAFARERWGWDGIAVERAAMVPDVMRGILEVLEIVSSPADAVVVNAPVYPPFYAQVRHTGRHVEEALLDAAHRIDLATLEVAYERAAARGPRPVHLLCSPHNPTGTVHTAEELAAVAALSARHGVRVVVDEIHAPLVGAGARFVPYLAVPGTSTAITLLSASKAWNLAGLKAALAVAGEDAAGDLRRIPPWVRVGGPSHVGVIAHVAAIRVGGPWLDDVNLAIDERRAFLAALLAERLPAARYRPGEGTYLAWLDLRELGLGDDPAAVLLERARVALNAGPTFGSGGAGHVRLNLAASRSTIDEAVRRMAAALG